MLFREETMPTLYFRHKPVLGPLIHLFAGLHQHFLTSWLVLSNPYVHSSRERLIPDKTISNIYFFQQPIFGLSNSGFDHVQRQLLKRTVQIRRTLRSPPSWKLCFMKKQGPPCPMHIIK